MALVNLPRPLIVDINGEPLVGARMFVYDAGTNNIRIAYRGPDYTIEHEQPIQSTEGGLFPAVYVDPSEGHYKLVIQNADGVGIYTEDMLEPGPALYEVTEAESSSSVVPADLRAPPYTPNRYRINETPGTTDMAAAIQTANDVAALAGAALRFMPEVYSVDIAARGGSSLSQTADWVGEGRTIIRRKDFTTTVASFTVQQTGQTGLRLSGITFDGQVTKAGSTSPNVDLGAAGSYADTTNEELWTKPYGVRLWNATRAIVENCTFMNFLRAGLFIEGDGLATGISQDVKVSNSTVRRTRSGSGGDAFYVGGATDVKFVNCHVYDYQRIGFCCEFARTDSSTNCRDLEFTNCTADFGHDVVAPESNCGFWVESGDNVKYVNCTSKNTGVGFVCNAGSNSDTGTTRPFAASIGYMNCVSLRSKVAMRLGFGGTRSTHVVVSGFQGEADRLNPAAAGESLGLRAGILIQAQEVATGVNFRFDLRDVSITCLNQSTGSASNGFGAIRVAQGTVTAPQQLVINLDGLQTLWKLANGNDDVSAKTDYQSATNGYFGDVVFSGAADTTPDGRYKGHATLSNLHNHTFGYAMVSTEIFSTSANFTVTKSRLCMRKASVANNGALTIADCPLVDFRGDVGWTKIQIDNSTVADADAASTDRTAISAGLTMLNNCHVLRQVHINANGGDTSHRKLRLVASGNVFDIPFDTEPALRLTLADSTFAHANLSGNVFRNVGTGNTDTTDSMILVSTATGVMQFSGAGNAFDNAAVSDGAHVVQYNSSPTYNDAPGTIATPFLSVIGALAAFDPI